MEKVLKGIEWGKIKKRTKAAATISESEGGLNESSTSKKKTSPSVELVSHSELAEGGGMLLRRMDLP